MTEKAIKKDDYFVVTRGVQYFPVRGGVADQFRESEIQHYDCSDDNRVFRVLEVVGLKIVAAECVFDGDPPSNVGHKRSFNLDQMVIVIVGVDYAKALCGG